VSAYATRPRPRTVYVCQTTYRPDEVTKDKFHYWSGPRHDQQIAPLATGMLSRRASGLWLIRTTSMEVNRSVDIADEKTARTRLCEWLGRMAGAQMMKFSPSQRIAMGQQQCPRIVGSRLCAMAPDPGSVWCEWHPHGKDRKDG
jgi:hypothetical protein